MFVIKRSTKFPLLPRKKFSDKSRYGHALVIAGSKNMSGAAYLAATACLKSGAGLVTLAAPKSVLSILAKKAPAELMALELGGYSRILSFIQKRGVRCVAIGPGLSLEKKVSALVRRLVQNIKVPVVLDADGLNAFRGQQAALRRHADALIVTPHAKEFERLFSVRCPARQSQRAALAKKLSRSYDVTIVLKGHRTLVVDGDRVYENRTGNPGMAKGGSGDVLTGVITAFIAQGLKPFEAAVWGAYYHGKAGDLAVKVKGELSLLASDTVDHLPRAFGNSLV